MKKVLVVVDMQNDFISGALGTKEANDILENVEKKIRDFDGEVIFTKDTHEKDYLSTQEGKNLPVQHCIRGSLGWEFPKSLQKIIDEKKFCVIEKSTFGSIDLAEKLSKENVSEITLIGICTDICVLSNAIIIKAYLPETKLIVDSSCCAGVTKKKHEAALEVMRSCQIEVI